MPHLVMIASCILFHSCILHRQLWRRDLPAGQNTGQQSGQQRLLREKHQAGRIWPPWNRNSRTRYSWAHTALFFFSVHGWSLRRAGKQQLIFLFIQPPSYNIYCTFALFEQLCIQSVCVLTPLTRHVRPQICLPSSLWGRGPRGRNRWQGPT